MTTTLPEGDIPTQVYAQSEDDSLLAYMKKYRESWIEVFNRLTAQVGEAEALKLTEEAESSILDGEAIVALRKDLHDAIVSAEGCARKAAWKLAELSSPRVYDVEFAHTGASEDIGFQLEAAARSLRAALALLPVDCSGGGR